MAKKLHDLLSFEHPYGASDDDTFHDDEALWPEAGTMSENDTDDEEFKRWEPMKRPAKTVKGSRQEQQARKKASYEANADVQRWLKEQGVDVSAQPVVAQPRFDPTLFSSQRDAPWLLSSLTPLYEQELITDVLHVVRSGKEATVFCCQAHPAVGKDYLAVKVYRPRMFRSLKNDADYRKNRMQRDEQGRVVHGGSRLRGAGRKSERGRAVRVSSWIEYEFETQRLLHRAGVHVPLPLAHVGNAVLMEYIGALGDAAPLLRDVSLREEEVETLFTRVLQDIELSLARGRVHGDLSEYNILYWQGELFLIDFAQAVDVHYDVYPLFERDVERVCQYFAHYGVQADASTLARGMWTRHVSPLM